MTTSKSIGPSMCSINYNPYSPKDICDYRSRSQSYKSVRREAYFAMLSIQAIMVTAIHEC